MSCGTHLPPGSLFCNKCGTPVARMTRSAEYKQVTVLFADVVHSMDIAKAVGPERLREIMAGLLDRATAVVARYGGTVDKFTGDGIMAVFGAPLALEDHAVRACRAALDIHAEIGDLADEVSRRDGVQLQLRIGLNSGQVIAGEVGSGGSGYTAIGEQVGLAQRMESAAPPGGVMLSASTARLVDTVASLVDPELVHIKGNDQPVVARRLLGVSDGDGLVAGAESALVGRRWEMAAVEGLLQRAMEGHGTVVTVLGSPGIGKSRLVREVTALAAARGVEVLTAHCESHTTQVPFHAVARLLRSATGVEHLDPEAARTRLRALDSDADPEDVLLFEDLLGIADPEVELPKIDPDARRRRLTALVNTASLAREAPAVYVIEDAHWIDEVSESMLADFLSVIPQTPSLVLITYRPEYRGALSQVQGAQTIALAPLSDPETGALVVGLLGSDPSLTVLARLIVERAAGNPFFAEEIVRDLAEQGVLQGQLGDYVSTVDGAEVSMPATVQATIAARIDRLDPVAKRALSAGAVIGTKFSRDLLESLAIDVALEDVVRGEFLDQVSFTGDPEYAFHHPLIRTVAYESQLKSDRAKLHRRLAAAIEARAPASADENAALIADHLEAAGDLHAAYGWHMRAAAWATIRDINAARLGWERAQTIADALPDADPDRLAMRIAPRTMLCGTAWRVHADVSGSYFEELRNLCTAADDNSSLAIAMSGLVSEHMIHGRDVEGSQLVTEQLTLIESLADPALTLGLSTNFISVKQTSGEMSAVLRVAENMIDIAEGDPVRCANIMGLGSPMGVALAARGFARCRLGRQGWRKDFDDATQLSKNADLVSRAIILTFKYLHTILIGALHPSDDVLHEVDESAAMASRFSDEFVVGMTASTLGLVLVHRDSPVEIARGIDILAEVAEMCRHGRFYQSELPVADLYSGWALAKLGDADAGIPIMRDAVDKLFATTKLAWCPAATGLFVEVLLKRASASDSREAETAVLRLAKAAVDDVPVRDIWLLRSRALLADANNDPSDYQTFRDRYRKMATDLGFEGHIAWAEEMP
jgi:class 3 adenylate cyclase